VKCLRGLGREQIGPAYSNPFFDTSEYDVKFTDGMTENYATNVIDDNMYASVDNEGNMFQLLLEIMDHKNERMAIDILDGTVTSVNGNVKAKIATKGWMLLVVWKDGLTSWVKLKDLKVSNPLNLQSMQWHIVSQRNWH
jgi:hypothetical protein